MLVRIVKDWRFPDILRQTPGHSGVWDNIRFTEEKILDFDLLVVLNAPNIPLTIKCSEKWLLSQESPIKLYNWHKRSFENFDRVYSFWNEENIHHDQTSLPWHVNKNYDQLKALGENELASKKDELSWVTSNYTNKPGHVLRMSLLSHLKEKGFAFDLFGKGFSPVEDKFDGLFPYKYSLAVENYSCNDYWTEKIADCFLSWTMPVYYGCKNIESYFPKEAMIIIDPNDPAAAMEIIKKAMEEKRWEKNLAAIKEARELVLDKYQFFPNISGKIKASMNDLPAKKWHYIPENTAGHFPGSKERIFNTFKVKLKNING